MDIYKEKYEQALERCKKEFNFNNLAYSHEEIKQRLERVFPELKESEDEKIRKSLINFLDDVWHRGKNANFDEYSKADCADWMNWLEKKKDANKEYWRGYREGKQEVLEKYAETEMQSKQKPANARKFKVGNWIVYCNEDVDLITGIEEKGYRINEGGYIPFACEDDMRLWTIQDAKDGDVLCGYPTDNYPWIGIFHELNDDYSFKSYCFLQAGITGKFCPPSGVNIFNKRNVDEHNSKIMVPATKEQRDLLFSKMKEAGYEWCAEKKELKKINLIKAEHGKYYYCIKDYFSGGKKFSSKGDVIQALRGLHIMGLEDISEYFLPVNNIQKPTWSEGNDKIGKQLLNWFKDCSWKAIDNGTLKRDDIIAWLEERV